jgi:hypothetical protein
LSIFEGLLYRKTTIGAILGMFMASNNPKITFIPDSWLTIDPKQQSMTHFSLGKTSLGIIGAVMGMKRALLGIL